MTGCAICDSYGITAEGYGEHVAPCAECGRPVCERHADVWTLRRDGVRVCSDCLTGALEPDDRDIPDEYDLLADVRAGELADLEAPYEFKARM